MPRELSLASPAPTSFRRCRRAGTPRAARNTTSSRSRIFWCSRLTLPSSWTCSVACGEPPKRLAFRDVSDALIGYGKYHQVRVREEESVKDLQDSVNLSLSRYRGGITTYLEVLDGQRSLYDAELTLAKARGSEYQSLVQLYKSLGGGWTR